MAHARTPLAKTGAPLTEAGTPLTEAGAPPPLSCSAPSVQKSFGAIAHANVIMVQHAINTAQQSLLAITGGRDLLGAQWEVPEDDKNLA